MGNNGEGVWTVSRSGKRKSSKDGDGDVMGRHARVPAHWLKRKVESRDPKTNGSGPTQ